MSSFKCKQIDEPVSMIYFSVFLMGHFNIISEKFWVSQKTSKKLFFWHICLSFLISGCGPPSKTMSQKRAIHLNEEVRIAVLMHKNTTEIEKLQKWPKNQAKADKLLIIFEEINTEFKNRLGNVSRLNRVKIVHQSQNPTIRIQLEFGRAEIVENGCGIPYSIRVYNQSDSRQDFEFSDSHWGKIKFNDANSPGFYIWGDIMQDYKATFPYAKILENLFILEE